MALAYRPHTILVLPAVEDIDETTLIVDETTYEEPEVPVTLLGQLTVKTVARIWEDYAVETSHPALLLFNIEDASKLHQGDRVEAVGFTWQVKTEPSLHVAQAVTDHGHVILEKLNA